MDNVNKLDLAAKLFPSVSNKNNSSVFRFSIVLKEQVDEKFLQIAVNMIYERFSIFFMRLRTGFFWNYFDKNRLYFTVEKEINSPCFTITSRENKDFMIKVLYFGHRVSVEAFHAITDGSGIVEFLKSLIFYYLSLKSGKIDDEGKILLFDEFDKNDFEDSFNKHFSNVKKSKLKTKNKALQKNSYRINGEKFKKKGNNTTIGIVSINSLKKHCKENNCTITAFLLANLFVSIYNAKQKFEKDLRPIVIAVPVNLRNIFGSTTLKNFFGVVNISFNVNEETKFSELVESITKQLKLYTDKDYLESESVQNTKMSENVVSKNTPLFIKNMVLPIGFALMGETKKTISVSNIGKIDLPSGLTPHIEHAELLIYPTPKSPINCSICSFEDKLSINFTRSIKDVEIIREFFVTLERKTNIEINVYSNEWEDDEDE